MEKKNTELSKQKRFSRRILDRSKAFYFYNDLTRESTWNAPDTPVTTADEDTAVDDGTTLEMLCKDSVMTSAEGSRQGEELLAPGVQERSVFAGAPCADGGTVAFGGSSPDATSTVFPFFVNARGNRVFVLPRSTVPPF